MTGVPSPPDARRLVPDDYRHGTNNGYQNYGCRCEPCTNARAIYEKARQSRPCAGECGTLVWGAYHPGRLCIKCLAAKRTIPIEERHGTETGYDKGCRCGSCTYAANLARAERRKKPNPKKHGTHASYSNGCRCDECRAAHAAYHRELRANKRAA